MAIKIALPKGRLLRGTATLLQKAGWGLDEYHSKMGFYYPKSQRFPDLRIRVFHEKDIPIQVSIGNYDLGICCLDWVEELMARYPSSDLIKVKDLCFGEGALYMAGKPPIAHSGVFRIISEYPNLAELYALKARLRRFSIFPVWGAAEVYPPENAELTLVAARTENELFAYGIMPVSKVLNFSAFLIANRHSWQSKNLDGIVTKIFNLPEVETKAPPQKIVKPERIKQYSTVEDSGEDIRLALPDGHQQQPTQDLLNRADIQVDDYPSEAGNRRPEISIEGVKVKVVRPQDMPLQVANGNFHLAITGRDWLREHLYQFTSSPVKELLDLKYGKVRLVAVVSNDLSIADIDGLRHLIASRGEPFRVASEYVNIADRFARDNHLGRYRVIPTWGATEAFLPEDADLLIENTQTGRTIARHNLKILNILFESTACLIGHAGNNYNAAKKERIKSIIERLRRAVEGTFS